MSNASWLNDSKLSVASVKALWFQRYDAINSKYVQAATAYADHVMHDTLDGVPEALRTTEFECALNTRNTMLKAAATETLRYITDEVKALECYEQYVDGLVTADECCNYILAHH